MIPFCIYYRNKAVCFLAEGADGYYAVPTAPVAGEDVHAGNRNVIRLNNNGTLTPAKVLKNLENSKSLYIVTPDPEQAFNEFCAQFVAVEAAGGVVANTKGEILMMRRRGWWDLPKGHVEDGETTLEAALREVEEETGLTGVEPGRLVTTTQHFYDTYGKWEMKRTCWYAMRYVGTDTPKPQIEEDITEIRWMRGVELWNALAGTYSTIRDVFGTYMRQDQ